MLCLVRYLFVISTSIIDCLGRFVPEITYYVSSGTLNLTQLKPMNFLFLLSFINPPCSAAAQLMVIKFIPEVRSYVKLSSTIGIEISHTPPIIFTGVKYRAVFVRFSLGGQSFDWRLTTIAGMEVAKLVPWNSLLN